MGHGPQTNEALVEPHARGRRGHAEHRLHLNRDRATRRNPSRAAQGVPEDQLVFIAAPAPPADPDAGCVWARG